MKYNPFESDEAWINALREEDPRAWGDLPKEEVGIVAHGVIGQLYQWASDEIGSGDQAEDIALEAAGRVLVSLDSLQLRASFIGWLRVVLMSVVLNRVSNYKYKLRTTLEAWLQMTNQLASAQLSALEQVIRRLDEDEQKVINLVRQGYKSEPMLTALGLSKPDFYKMKYQALMTLFEDQAFLPILQQSNQTQSDEKIGKSAATVLVEYDKLQEMSLEDLFREDDFDEDTYQGTDSLPAPTEFDADTTIREGAVSDCIDQLSPRLKAVVQRTWHYRVVQPIDENIDERIAQDLAITVGNVALRRLRAKESIKRCLADET